MSSVKSVDQFEVCGAAVLRTASAEGMRPGGGAYRGPERRLKRGVDLQAAINRFVVDHNQQPKPFVWTADPDKIIAAATRERKMLESIH